MPLLSTRGAAAATGFGFLNSPRTVGFVGRLTGENTAIGRGVAGTSGNEIYVVGDSTDNSSIVGAHIAKFNANGLQWQKRLTGGTTRFYKCAVAASGNVYAAGLTSNPGSNYGFLVKYSSSGTLLWQRQLGYASGFVGFYGIEVDSSENVFVTGLSAFYGITSSILVKYDSNGNVLFQKDCGGGSYAVLFEGSPAVASSGNIYCVGYVELAGYAYDPFVAKYNSSGVLQWQRRITTGTFGQGIALDSNENCYVIGFETDGFLIKINSSGVIQWTRQTSLFTPRSVAVDSSDNIYISGQYYSPSTGTTTAKYDATGVLLFSRRLATSSGTGFDIAVVGDSFYTNGYGFQSAGNDQMFFGRFPNSGDGIGSYSLGTIAGTNIVVSYSNISITSSTVTYATTTTTYSDRSPALTSSASTLTESAPTYPSAVAGIIQ